METLIKTGFIFDMDGVLVDNAYYHTQAWLLLFERLGISVDPRAFHLENAGQTNAAILRWKLGEKLPDDQINAYAQEKETLYRELYRPHLEVLPGLRAFLDQSQNLGIPLALATSAEEQNIALVLDGLDLRRYFPIIVGANDIQHSKPNPEIFLTAAGRLGLPPAGCVVFEDSLAGVEAARRAGMRLVLVTTSLDRQDMGKYYQADLAILDYAQITPSEFFASTGNDL
jgi:beta-phosphoglucomutase family hydrolase